MEYEEYSVDNGLTWIRTGNERQSSIILETNSKDCGYSSGNTECDNETIAFSWSGTATSFKLDINETEYTATTNPYSATLTELGIDKFTSAKEMFMNIEHSTIVQITTITSIPCTNNVTDMSFMFYYCGSLTSLDLSHFDTSNVTDMTYMFGGCNSLTSLDVTHFNTSNVTNMTYMFMACDSLTSLDVTHFNTSNVTTMQGMFHHCIGLTSLDLSNFNTSNVTNMGGMFSSCPNLRILDLSNWDISNVTDVSGMFRYCKPLTIKVTNCNDITISKLQEAIDDSGFTSTVANGIITVNYKS
jgi:surface protein